MSAAEKLKALDARWREGDYDVPAELAWKIPQIVAVVEALEPFVPFPPITDVQRKRGYISVRHDVEQYDRAMAALSALDEELA